MADENLRGIFWFVMKILRQAPPPLSFIERTSSRAVKLNFHNYSVKHMYTSIHTEDENVPVIQL